MAIRRYDMFGINDLTLEDARSMVEKTLGFRFARRNSRLHGGTYYLYRLNTGKEYKLYSNFDATKSEWIQDHYKDYSILLSVSDLDNMDDIQKQIMASCKKTVLIGSSTIANS